VRDAVQAGTASEPRVQPAVEPRPDPRPGDPPPLHPPWLPCTSRPLQKAPFANG